jgi:hypothetical protein
MGRVGGLLFLVAGLRIEFRVGIGGGASHGGVAEMTVSLGEGLSEVGCS